MDTLYKILKGINEVVKVTLQRFTFSVEIKVDFTKALTILVIARSCSELSTPILHAAPDFKIGSSGESPLSG